MRYDIFSNNLFTLFINSVLWAKRLSSMFVQSHAFGTSSTLLVIYQKDLTEKPEEKQVPRMNSGAAKSDSTKKKKGKAKKQKSKKSDKKQEESPTLAEDNAQTCLDDSMDTLLNYRYNVSLIGRSYKRPHCIQYKTSLDPIAMADKERPVIAKVNYEFFSCKIWERKITVPAEVPVVVNTAVDIPPQVLKVKQPKRGKTQSSKK